MTAIMPQQTMPIIIKGRKTGGFTTSPIEIEANSDFQVTEEFQSQPGNWVQSNSDFVISYVESVVVGEMGAGQQYCQTSLMTHPLRYEFKDVKNNNIFTISEIAAGGNYMLQIAVAVPDDYFEITATATAAVQSNAGWSASAFNTEDADILAVEVVNASNIPVCRILVPAEANIYLNLEPTP